VIPARLKSTRLKEKPLVEIAGAPLVKHVYENIANIKLIDEVIVAADDALIVDAVKDFGGNVMLTPKELKSGTDRVAFVSLETYADIVINVQCDEPFIKSEMIEAGLKPFMSDSGIVMGSLKTRISSKEELFDPNVVKVVTDGNDNALYFSRLPIPYIRDRFNSMESMNTSELDMGENIFFKHLGIYFYTPEFLHKFSKMPESYLERSERLEQLRALENGYDIVVPTTKFDSLGIDTEDDLEKARKIFKDMGRNL
jgi:3-deoxy-manno-octulosonate cytidylyltransferase (CMP-KDO synthetase)